MRKIVVNGEVFFQFSRKHLYFQESTGRKLTKRLSLPSLDFSGVSPKSKHKNKIVSPPLQDKMSRTERRLSLVIKFHSDTKYISRIVVNFLVVTCTADDHIDD